MRALRTTKEFDRDLRRAKRRGKTLDKLWEIVELLVRGEPLPSRCRRHWLLIWDEAEQTLTLVRTGTHADLFE
jgi:mRNA interferase YafQ